MFVKHTLKPKKSNTHKMKNTISVLREPRKNNSHHRLDIAKPGA